MTKIPNTVRTQKAATAILIAHGVPPSFARVAVVEWLAHPSKPGLLTRPYTAAFLIHFYNTTAAEMLTIVDNEVHIDGSPFTYNV